MKMSEIKKMETAELLEKVQDLKTKLANLNVSHAVTPLQNPMEIRKTRKTIARLLTELNQRGN